MIVNRFDKIYYALIGAIALLILVLYSYSTSFIYDKPALGDAAIFMTIGKAWANGFEPYIDLWDSKGPIIFLVNGIGYWLFGNKCGVLLVQYVCLLISAIAMYKLLRIGFERNVSLLFLFFVLLSFASLGIGCNTVAEYVLPLLSTAYYRFYMWSKDVEKGGIVEHRITDAMLYGIIVSFCAFSRLTNCIGVCLLVAFVTIWLIKERRWSNLLCNILFFFIGVLIVALPICSYFIWRGTFEDMWFATFEYNLDYAKTSSGYLFSLTGILKSMIIYSEIWILAVVSIVVLVFSKTRKQFGALWMLISGFTILYLIRSNGYAHYGIISLPLLCVSLLEIKVVYEESSIMQLRWIKNAICVIYMSIVVAYNIHSARVFVNNYLDNEELNRYDSFLSDIPKDYKNSFIAYNPSPHIYFYMNIMPKYRFFVFQDFGANINEKYNEMLKQTYSKCTAEWILVENSDYAIKDVLHSGYEIYKKDQGMILYRRK